MKFTDKIKYLACLGLFLSMASGSLAQDQKHDFRYYDRATYNLFIDGIYDSLITVGKQALKEGYDYFYLRLRIGLACFHTGNYRLSSWHLEKARAMNTNDSTAIKYLFMSYLYSNRESEAAALAGSVQFKLKSLPPYRLSSFPGEVYAEAGYIFSDAKTGEEKGMKKNHRPETDLGITDLNLNRFFASAGIQFRPHSNLTSFVGYNYISSQKQKIIDGSYFVKSGYDTIPYQGWYYVDTLYEKRINTFTDDYRLTQHQLYANTAIIAGKRWKITPAFQLIFLDYKTIYPVFEPGFAQSYDTLPAIGEYSVEKMNSTSTDYVASLGVTKSLKRSDVGLRSSLSHLNGLDQYQAEVSCTWFPSGNLNTYTHSVLMVQSEDGNTDLLFQQMAGLKLFPKTWLEGSIQAGRMRNYNESNGFIVYNTGDFTRVRAGLNLLFMLAEGMQWTFRFNYYALRGNSIEYSNADANFYHTETFDYNNYSLTGGFLWKL